MKKSDCVAPSCLALVAKVFFFFLKNFLFDFYFVAVIVCAREGFEVFH